MDSVERPPAIVGWTLRLEDAAALDVAVEAIESTNPQRVRHGSAGRGVAWGVARPRGPSAVDRRRARHLDLGHRARSVRRARVRRGRTAVDRTRLAGCSAFYARVSRTELARCGATRQAGRSRARHHHRCGQRLYGASWVARLRGSARHPESSRLALAGAAASRASPVTRAPTSHRPASWVAATPPRRGFPRGVTRLVDLMLDLDRSLVASDKRGR